MGVDVGEMCCRHLYGWRFVSGILNGNAVTIRSWWVRRGDVCDRYFGAVSFHFKVTRCCFEHQPKCGEMSSSFW